MFNRTNHDFILAAAFVFICLVQTGVLLFGNVRRLVDVLDKSHYKGSAESLLPAAEKLLWAYLVVAIVGLMAPTNIQRWLLAAGVGLILVYVACNLVSQTRIVIPVDSGCDTGWLLGVLALAPECRTIARSWGKEVIVRSRSAVEVQNVIAYLNNSKSHISRRWLINSLSKALALAFAAGLLAINLLHLYIDKLMLGN